MPVATQIGLIWAALAGLGVAVRHYRGE